VVICLEQGANGLHMVQLMLLPVCHPIISCFDKIYTDLIFLAAASQGCHGKEES